MIVEARNGDLLVDWFHGSGERTADDVVIRGARLKKGAKAWSGPFFLADTPGYRDTNATMFIDRRQRLWLLWPTILANEWHTALMKYKISSDYQHDGPPRWETNEVLHVIPGDEFKTTVDRELDRLTAGSSLDDRIRQYVDKLRKDAGDKLTRRLGWMTRAHPYVLGGTRLIVPLYSDGFSLSLMAITDDWGATWPWIRHLEKDPETSGPQQRGEYHDPSIIQARDGTLQATYSYFIPPAGAKKDDEGRLIRKTIKHAHFNEAWIRGR
jgi:BNR repeat protein